MLPLTMTRVSSSSPTILARSDLRTRSLANIIPFGETVWSREGHQHGALLRFKRPASALVMWSLSRVKRPSGRSTSLTPNLFEPLKSLTRPRKVLRREESVL